MRLSDMGCDVHQCWNGIPQHFPFVILDSFIVMPDHVHGILIINKHLSPVETRHGASLREPINQFGPLQIQSLQLVVNQFKSACTRRIRQFFPEFRWQSRFYDRIIRDDRGMDRIRDYIECNPIIDPVGCHVSEMKKPTSKID